MRNCFTKLGYYAQNIHKIRGYYVDFVVIVEAQTFFCGRLYQNGILEITRRSEKAGVAGTVQNRSSC